jgi:hypothetical protein
MSVRGVRAETTVFSAFVTFMMIILGAVGVGCPVALIIILICLATDGGRLP